MASAGRAAERELTRLKGLTEKIATDTPPSVDDLIAQAGRFVGALPEQCRAGLEERAALEEHLTARGSRYGRARQEFVSRLRSAIEAVRSGFAAGDGRLRVVPLLIKRDSAGSIVTGSAIALRHVVASGSRELARVVNDDHPSWWTVETRGGAVCQAFAISFRRIGIYPQFRASDVVDVDALTSMLGEADSGDRSHTERIACESGKIADVVPEIRDTIEDWRRAQEELDFQLQQANALGFRLLRECGGILDGEAIDQERLARLRGELRLDFRPAADSMLAAAEELRDADIQAGAQNDGAAITAAVVPNASVEPIGPERLGLRCIPGRRSVLFDGKEIHLGGDYLLVEQLVKNNGLLHEDAIENLYRDAIDWRARANKRIHEIRKKLRHCKLKLRKERKGPLELRQINKNS